MFDTVFHSPSWDVHGYSPFSTFSTLREEVGPQFDAGFTTLIEDLAERELLKTTMVVAVGEFRPQPAYQPKRRPGPSSVVLVRTPGGGRSAVASPPRQRGRHRLHARGVPSVPPEFVATVYHGLNVPCNLMIDGPNFEPQKLIDDGVEPVYELFLFERLSANSASEEGVPTSQPSRHTFHLTFGWDPPWHKSSTGFSSEPPLGHVSRGVNRMGGGLTARPRRFKWCSIRQMA